MNVEISQQLLDRARMHRALGEPIRLAIVESLWCTDRTPSELRSQTALDWNALAFHLNTLERAGLVERTRSEGDARRRYVSLRPDAAIAVRPPDLPRQGGRPRTLFVCTHNAARSQFAMALWRKTTGLPADSAGSDPASEVHPFAVEVAARHGVDLAGARPRGYDARRADRVITVCDRAREKDAPAARVSWHWSVADPIDGTADDFEHAFEDIRTRIVRLAAVST